MATADEQAARELREELAELRVALERKRSEISNLKVGYIRSVERGGPIPPDPLRRNLVHARAELTELESRLEALDSQLGDEPPGPAT